MSESMSCWICATIESALDDMAVLLLHNRWVVLPIIAQSRRSFNATMFTCRFRIRPHGLWSHSKHFIRDPSQEVRIAFRILLRNVAHSLGAICVLPPVIHRIGIKDAIQSDPRFHPELSHVYSPS